MKIIFDSNVWQIVVIPDDYSEEPYQEAFRKIKDAIVEGKIEPYVSETIFTIEAIKKVERQDFFSSQKPKLKIEVEEKRSVVSISMQIGPNNEDAINFTDRPILKKYFDEAIRLGFKIVRLPRIGGFVNEEIEEVRYKLYGTSLSDYLTKVFEVAGKIESNGAGISQLEKIGEEYGGENWMKSLKGAPPEDWKRIAKAAAEWADGDSVAISIALGCDYFCTRDKAKGAGSLSVLSHGNLEWLNRDYGFKTILPEDLDKII